MHYLKAEHAEAHEVLLCLQTQTVMSDPKRMRYPSDQFYMKSGAEMAGALPRPPGGARRTPSRSPSAATSSCELDKELHFPKFKVPEGHDAEDVPAEALAREGLRAATASRTRTTRRTTRRSGSRTGSTSRWASSRRPASSTTSSSSGTSSASRTSSGIPVGPGRGSGAGSLVAYALGITGIDPLRYDLIFERFLNPERVSPPDFDIDFCQARRGEVIEYVKQKYGRDNVAQIITFGTLGAKTVIRDVGRVLEIPLAECDRLAKMVPEDPEHDAGEGAGDEPGVQARRPRQDPNAKRIMKYARVLEGLPRNPGTHAAGVVIGERPLIETRPAPRATRTSEIITQYEMKPLGEIGLLKMDFLGPQDPDA